jgi:hypothetical protein
MLSSAASRVAGSEFKRFVTTFTTALNLDITMPAATGLHQRDMRSVSAFVATSLI